MLITAVVAPWEPVPGGSVVEAEAITNADNDRIQAGVHASVASVGATAAATTIASALMSWDSSAYAAVSASSSVSNMTRSDASSAAASLQAAKLQSEPLIYSCYSLKQSTVHKEQSAADKEKAAEAFKRRHAVIVEQSICDSSNSLSEAQTEAFFRLETDVYIDFVVWQNDDKHKTLIDFLNSVQSQTAR